MGTLPRLAPPLFIQLPKPFAHHDDDSDDNIEHGEDERFSNNIYCHILLKMYLMYISKTQSWAQESVGKKGPIWAKYLVRFPDPLVMRVGRTKAI